MAFQFISNVDFEDGTLGSFDTETDTQPKLDFPHYSVLAQTPGLAMPYSGAYGMRIDLSVGTTDAYLEETGDWDIANNASQYFRFMFWVSEDLTMANGDIFHVMTLNSAAAIEGAIDIKYTTAAGFQIGFGKVAATSLTDLTLGQWHSVELLWDAPAAGGSETIDMWFDGAALTQVASLTHLATTFGRIGVQGVDAGTTKGILLFDEVISDSTRIYPPATRFKTTRLLTKDGHAFVGPGRIENISLLSGNGTDCVVTVFDTDEADVTDAGNIVIELKNTTANELIDPAGTPVCVKRGAFIQMTGTDPRALVKSSHLKAYGSDGAIRSYGLRRKPWRAVS